MNDLKYFFHLCHNSRHVNLDFEFWQMKRNKLCIVVLSGLDVCIFESENKNQKTTKVNLTISSQTQQPQLLPKTPQFSTMECDGAWHQKYVLQVMIAELGSIFIYIVQCVSVNVYICWHELWTTKKAQVKAHLFDRNC